jgi:hypothetical protein
VAGCGVRHRPSSGSTFNALLGVCAEYGDHPAALDTLDMMTYHRYGASAAPPATLVVFDWDLPMWRLFLSRNIEGAADAASTPTTPASCTCCAPAGRRGHWLAVPAQLRAQPVNTHPPHSAVSWRRPSGAAVLALLQALEGTPLYADGFSEGSAAAVSTRDHNQN